MSSLTALPLTQARSDIHHDLTKAELRLLQDLPRNLLRGVVLD